MGSTSITSINVGIFNTHASDNFHISLYKLLMLHIILEENKMERTTFCDNIIYGWKKNEEQEKEMMMMIMMMMRRFTLTEERTEWNCNLYPILNLREF
jgi:hypothetical protein